MKPEDNSNVNQASENIQSAEEYLEAIKNLKENTVDKALYEKVLAEKKALVKGIAEGIDFSEHEKQKEKPDLKKISEKLRKSGEEGMLNAEYVKTALELREACLAEGIRDPFLPLGIKRKPDNEDLAGAERVAQGMQKMLDDATDDEGNIDPDMFNAILKKTIAADSPILTAKLNKSSKKRI